MRSFSRPNAVKVKIVVEDSRQLKTAIEISVRMQHRNTRLLQFRPFSLLDALIEGLQHPCIDCGDHIYGRVQLFFSHACFPCVRKAPIHSRIAEPHHRNGETDEHFLALGEAFDGVRIAVECSEISFFHCFTPCFAV